MKFAYKAVSLTKRLEEVDRPSLEVRCSMVKLLIECEQLGNAGSQTTRGAEGSRLRRGRGNREA
jgi:hypothetical protein